MNTAVALKNIADHGYHVVEGYIDGVRLQRFMPEVYARFARQSYNGTVGYVEVPFQRYLQYTLTVHEEILAVYLDPFIVACCEEYVGSPVHLQDYRIYQNLKGCRMHWHVDNKQTNLDLSSTLLTNNGLIAIVYLDAVDHGAFEIIEGSHRWAYQANVEDWDAVIDNYKNQIVTFNNLPAGTLILYDFRSIHRAQPFREGSPRTALFAQYAGIDWPAGEPIYVDPGMLVELSDRDRRILRFGRRATAPTWPIPADRIQAIATGEAKEAREPGKQLLKKMIAKVRHVHTL
jgi:ectoine hydroxylase-related dioxygenase (phytanoyl-CoA dioxygenase family)